MTNAPIPSLDDILGSSQDVSGTRLFGEGRDGKLPLTEAMLLDEPSGNLFAMTQNVGMGWNPEELGRQQFLIMSTHGGLRGEDGTPIALGYHTGHWEITCWCARRRKPSVRKKRFPSPRTAPIRAMGGHRARKA